MRLSSVLLGSVRFCLCIMWVQRVFGSVLYGFSASSVVHCVSTELFLVVHCLSSVCFLECNV